MGNYCSVKTEVENYIRARTPFIVIETSERERIERMMREIAIDHKMNIDYYTDSKQVYNIGNEKGYLDAQHDPLQYAIDQFKKKKGMIFVIGDIKHIDSDNSYSRELLNALYIGKENSCTLIAVTADTVWSRLLGLGLFTSLDYPNYNERIRQITDFIGLYKHRYKIEWDQSDINRSATVLRGFSEIQIENILSAELITNNGFKKDKIYRLTTQKNRLYGSMPNIQLIHVPNDIDVAGLSHLKNWLKDKKNIFFASDEELRKYDLQPPKGILLAGVPGCGKSISAKMVSIDWELPLFKFDIDTIYDKWVGESERKMKEALKFIDNVAPCILWVDEIEKALSTSDNGNDTGKRILGQFLFWLQESTSRVFLIATANDISILPPELFRKGRFSEIFFIDLPNKKEREILILQYLSKSLHLSLTTENIAELVEVSKGYSFADIEMAIKEAAQLLVLSPNKKLSYPEILEKFKSIVPISKNNPEIIQKCQEWGNKRAFPASIREEDD